MKRLLKLISIFVLANSIQVASAQDTMFVDRSESSGMQDEFIYRQLGVAWGDYDGDGFDDVFIATSPENRLFKNNGDLTFTDVAEEAGIKDAMAEAAVGVWGDYDADGDLDLFVGNLSPMMGDGMPMMAKNRLYRNDDGGFVDMAESAGVSGMVESVTGGTVSASWSDYDRDGWIDLLVCNRVRGVFLYRNRGDGGFENATTQAGLSMTSCEHGVWADYDRDGDADLFLSAGDGMMMNPSMMDGMSMAAPAQMGAMMPTSNKLYQNQGDGSFIDVTETAGLVSESNMARSHTAVWGDFNGDGYPDLFSGNRGSITMNTLAPSRLYRNNQDGTFTDVYEEAGMNDEYSVFGAAWADVDNDGRLDLYIAIHPDMRDHPDHHINPTRIPHPLYMANEDGTFTDVNEDILDLPYVSGITDLGHQGGAAFGDADNDGDLDLVVVEAMGLGPMRFYENANAATGANWIKLSLRSDSPNTRAIGAKIIVEAGGMTNYREVGFSSTGWASQSPYEQTIGLGSSEAARVAVIWPNGVEDDLGELAANREHVIVEPPQSAISDWMVLN